MGLSEHDLPIRHPSLPTKNFPTGIPTNYPSWIRVVSRDEQNRIPTMSCPVFPMNPTKSFRLDGHPTSCYWASYFQAFRQKVLLDLGEGPEPEVASRCLHFHIQACRQEGFLGQAFPHQSSSFLLHPSSFRHSALAYMLVSKCNHHLEIPTSHLSPMINM